MPGDIFDDPVVGCRTAPYIMLRLKSINGNRNIESRDGRPTQRNLAESAGHQLNVDAALGQLRQQNIQFAITNKRITANNREMQRTVFIHQRQHFDYEIITLVVRELPKRKSFARMA